jgi:recombination protein RecR
MDNRVKEIEELIKLISKFPGLGPKSARRIALHLLKNKDTIVKPLSQSLTDVYNKVIRCSICGNIKSKEIKCTIDQCSYYKEKYDKICVVENLADMWVILSGNIFSGYFHVLGGTISSREKFDQKNLLIDSLIQRVRNNSLKEVIIATSATVEGQTTAHFIEDAIKNSKIKITKLAQGLPVGGEIEQLDDGTLYSAFENRVPVTND